MRRCAEILWTIRKDYRELSRAEPTTSWTETAHMEQSRKLKATFQFAYLQFKSKAWRHGSPDRWAMNLFLELRSVKLSTRRLDFLEIVCLLDSS
jgi:hypothetical protein